MMCRKLQTWSQAPGAHESMHPTLLHLSCSTLPHAGEYVYMGHDKASPYAAVDVAINGLLLNELEWCHHANCFGLYHCEQWLHVCRKRHWSMLVARTLLR